LKDDLVAGSLDGHKPVLFAHSTSGHALAVLATPFDSVVFGTVDKGSLDGISMSCGLLSAAQVVFPNNTTSLSGTVGDSSQDFGHIRSAAELDWVATISGRKQMEWVGDANWWPGKDVWAGSVFWAAGDGARSVIWAVS
jgi:hypothetical protein